MVIQTRWLHDYGYSSSHKNQLLWWNCGVCLSARTDGGINGEQSYFVISREDCSIVMHKHWRTVNILSSSSSPPPLSVSACLKAACSIWPVSVNYVDGFKSTTVMSAANTSVYLSSLTHSLTHCQLPLLPPLTLRPSPQSRPLTDRQTLNNRRACLIAVADSKPVSAFVHQIASG